MRAQAKTAMETAQVVSLLNTADETTRRVPGCHSNGGPFASGAA